MRRTLNALTTKLAGRVKPFLNIPTALMTALAVGGFGLSLWMVDDSMKDRNAMSHMRATPTAHSLDPLTAQSCTVLYAFDSNIRSVKHVSVSAHYYIPSGAPAQPETWTVEASANAMTGVRLVGGLRAEFCYMYFLKIEGYAQIGYYRGGPGGVLTYDRDNLDLHKPHKDGMICRRRVELVDAVTGAITIKYVDDSPKSIEDDGYVGRSLQYGSSHHHSHESHARVTAGAVQFRGWGIIHSMPYVSLNMTHGVP